MAQHPHAIAGVVLAAGAGSRFGGPKALARDSDGEAWIALAVEVLREGGCAPVVVTLGASADHAQALVPANAEPVRVEAWTRGLSASVAAGLDAAAAHEVDAVVVMPVDTPDAAASAVRRVIAAAGPRPRRALVQATYARRPGHPVLIGADHVRPLIAALEGDRGARDYLRANGAVALECEDLWSGADIDTRSEAGSGG
ncbi:nucleotidyltransferase family protein [Microbacterium limosum]|uniref:Nucleotidyltransferase family protein n=1 Tax=Microbacterium limosum TaxID=3079935 RepID=A0AAU0MHY0_9MICO|nr:nucleotidyltransferase family protein [Microbacterium sp. Y20]WOQ69776.1 nucleotidyltransferase family protein [Microbacterium sp. Y20]